MVKKILIVYTAIIILLAILPINNGESFLNDNFILLIRLDYVVHFAIFIPWMIITWLNYNSGNNQSVLMVFCWILLGLTLAIATECAQYFLPYRSFNINDMVANVMGILLGCVFFLFKPKSKRETEL